MQEKKIPERKCVACGARRPKSEFVRVVRTPAGEILLDRTGRANGRGAYLCPDAACLRRARKGDRIGRALDVSVPSDVYDALEAQLSQ